MSLSHSRKETDRWQSGALGRPPPDASHKTLDGADEGGLRRSSWSGGPIHTSSSDERSALDHNCIPVAHSALDTGCPRAQGASGPQRARAGAELTRGDPEGPQEAAGGREGESSWNGVCHTLEGNGLPSPKCEKAVRPGKSVRGLHGLGPGVQHQASAGWVPPEALRENPFHGLSPRPGTLAVLGVLGFQTPHSSLCLIIWRVHVQIPLS